MRYNRSAFDTDMRSLGRALAKSCSRRRDGIYLYLRRVYSVARKWQRLDRSSRKRVKRAFAAAKHVKGSARVNSIKLIIDGTSDADPRLRWKYIAALKFARSSGVRANDVQSFIRANGGINGCVTKYLRKRENSRPTNPSGLRGRAHNSAW
jgi:hypothetical protein